MLYSDDTGIDVIQGIENFNISFDIFLKIKLRQIYCKPVYLPQLERTNETLFPNTNILIQNLTKVNK